MNREELVEDLKLGQIIKVGTTFGDIFIGTVVKIDETSMKINLLDTDKVKRISYDIILDCDYDYEPDNESKILIDRKESQENIAQKDEDSNEKKNDAVKNQIKEMINNLWALDTENRNLSLSAYKDFSKNIKQELLNYFNSLKDAKKNHEFNAESYKVKDVLDKLDLNPNRTSYDYIFEGYIYYDLTQFYKAADCFFKGKDYEAAFLSAMDANDKERATDYAMMSVIHGVGNNNLKVIRFLCEQAKEKNDHYIIAVLLKYGSSYLIEVMFFWFDEREFINKIPYPEALKSEENLNFLRTKFYENYPNVDTNFIEKKYLTNESDNECVENREYIPDIIEKSEDFMNEHNPTTEFGQITWFDRQNGWGFINKNNEKIYFQIYQVIDEQLFNLLSTKNFFEYKVSYITGINKNGLAADEIRLAETIEEKKGTIESYDNRTSQGFISCDKKDYIFSLRDITDPDLMEIITDLDAIGQVVVFNSVEMNGLLRATKIERKSSSKKKFNYMPLTRGYSKAKNLMKQKDPFHSNNYSNYCARAHWYLDKGDLDNAAKLYLKAIEVGEKLETAVPDLNSIYMRTGQLEESLNLLNKHETDIKRSVFLNLKMGTLDKLKKYEDELEICFELLESVSDESKKMHFLLKIAQIYNAIGCYDEALNYYEQWEKKSSLFNSGKIQNGLRVSVMRGKAISLSNIGRIEEAKKIAEAILKSKPEDEFATALLSGENIEDMESFVLNELQYAQIDDFVKDCLNEIKLETEKTISEKISDGIYQGNEKNTIDIIRYMVKRGSANVEDKYNNFMRAAKLVKTILDREDQIQNTKELNEQKYQFYLAKAMLFKGDCQLVDAEIKGFEMARYCYWEVSNIILDAETIYSCWLDSFMRYIQTFFSNFNVNEKHKAPSDDICEETEAEKLVENLCRESFCAPLKTDISDFVIGLMMFLFNGNVNNRKFGEIIIENLEKSGLRNEISKYLETILHSKEYKISENTSCERFFDKWEAVVKIYSKIQRDFNRKLQQILENIFKLEIEEIDALNRHDFLNYLNRDEKDYWNKLYNILRNVVNYREQRDFDRKSELLKETANKILELRKEIEEFSTKYSYDVIRKILNELEIKIDQEAKSLYAGSLPEINIEFDAKYHNCLNSKTGEVAIPISFKNKENVQNAKQVKIDIFVNPPFVLKDDSALKEISEIRSDRPESRLLFFNKNSDNETQTLDFSVKVSYKYLVSLGDEEQMEQEPIPFSVPLYDEKDFVQIKNEFKPYIGGNTIPLKEMFYGRWKYIDEIVNCMMNEDGTMKKGQAVALYGQTRTGKTSIAYYIKDKLRKRDPEHNIIIDIGSLGDLHLEHEDTTELLYTIMFELQNELSRRISDEECDEEFKEYYPNLKEGDFFHHELFEKLSKDEIDIDPEEILGEHPQLIFNTKFKNFCRFVKNLNPLYNIILMIDEFTYIFDWIRQGRMDKSITKYWKALLQNNNISAIIIGQDHMMQFINEPEFSNDFQTTELKKVTYLSEDDAKALMNNPIKYLRDGKEESRYKDGALDRLYELTSGSAFLIMNFCAKLVDYLNEQKSIYMTIAHIEDFLRKHLAEFEESRFFEPQYNDKSKVDNREIVEKNKKILLAIARKSYKREWADVNGMQINGIKENELQSMLDKLVERDVLEKEGNKYKIKVALYKEWLIKNHGLGD